MAGVVITSNAVIGDHVCILPNTVIHHDVVVGAWSLIGSGVTIAGGVVIGENCYVGSGSSIIHGVKLGTACWLVWAPTSFAAFLQTRRSLATRPARSDTRGRAARVDSGH